MLVTQGDVIPNIISFKFDDFAKKAVIMGHIAYEKPLSA